MSGSFSSDAFSATSFSAEGIEDMPSSAANTVVAAPATFRIGADDGAYTVRSDNRPFQVE